MLLILIYQVSLSYLSPEISKTYRDSPHLKSKLLLTLLRGYEDRTTVRVVTIINTRGDYEDTRIELQFAL